MQTNEEKKIANCPFCRATAQLYIRNNQYTVRCNNHNCIAYDIEPHFISADAAISAWNASERATTDTQEAEPGKWMVCPKHGKWKVWGMFDDLVKCSCCGYEDTLNHVTYESLRYCGKCGAKMGEDEK